MKPAIGLITILVLLVAGDLFFNQGRGVQALEISLNHLLHKRLVE
jgi:hypothetical protein